MSAKVSYILDADNNIHYTHKDKIGFKTIQYFRNNKTKIKSMAAGYQHVLILTTKGNYLDMVIILDID